MLNRRVGHILSAILAPLAFALPLSLATGVENAQAKESSGAASCFIGVEYDRLSFEALHELIAAALQQLDRTLISDDAVAIEIGRQLGRSAARCSSEQIAALAQNVALILNDLGVRPNGSMAELIKSGMPLPVKQAGAFDSFVSLSLMSSVY